MDRIKYAFPPSVDANTQVLVLGSLPGEASLIANQYYAHPRNVFWRLMDSVTGRNLSQLAYDDRLLALKDAGVGLWDVIVSAERSGSLDSAIRSPGAADVRGLVARLPDLRAVAFNGGTAARLGRRALGPEPRLTLIDLPSSSPAHARPFAEKAAAWSVLTPYLR